MRRASDWLVWRDLLITKRCIHFNHPKALDDIPRKHVIELEGVFERHKPEYTKMNPKELRALTGLSIKSRTIWHRALGVWVDYERPGWRSHPKEA